MKRKHKSDWELIPKSKYKVDGNIEILPNRVKALIAHKFIKKLNYAKN